LKQDEHLKRLDEIEMASLDPTADAGAIQLMEDFAATPEGLRQLVDRYSSSPSAYIVGSLALVLGKSASSGSLEAAALVFRFVEKLRRKDYAEALISSLSAIEVQISFGCGWEPTLQPPPVLSTFLMHCLEYSGRHSILVQDGALSLLATICEKGLLDVALPKETRPVFRKRIEELAALDNDLLNADLPRLLSCFAELP